MFPGVRGISEDETLMTRDGAVGAVSAVALLGGLKAGRATAACGGPGSIPSGCVVDATSAAGSLFVCDSLETAVLMLFQIAACDPNGSLMSGAAGVPANVLPISAASPSGW